jgi:hypothetical protein
MPEGKGAFEDFWLSWTDELKVIHWDLCISWREINKFDWKIMKIVEGQWIS